MTACIIILVLCGALTVQSVIFHHERNKLLRVISLFGAVTTPEQDHIKIKKRRATGHRLAMDKWRNCNKGGD